VNFDEFDKRLRIFETAHDHCVLPGIHMVARLDGRNFTRLTKEIHPFESPYDERFRDYMLETVEHLMQCGFRVIYGYTQSDEISLLFHLDEQMFGRKIRKFISILAGEASAYFSLQLGTIGCFDCRISQLPGIELITDYFRWRQEDAYRNALNAYCYWLLCKQGKSASEATEVLGGLPVAAKNEFLFSSEINFNDLPNWQKRGVGLYWETYALPARNPMTGDDVLSERKRIRRDLDLPSKEDYARFIVDIVQHSGEGEAQTVTQKERRA
jgi:tRNA(His) guanylyltransferase